LKEENVALYMDGKGQNKNKKPWKKYKGNCNWCGIQGHKAVDCMKRKAAENKPDGTRIPESQKKCYRCKANGHITRNCPEEKDNKNGDAFFVRMCNNKEDDEEEERQKEEDIRHCPNCRATRLVGLECDECEDTGVIYKKYGIYCQPETSNAQGITTETQSGIMELPVMTELHKENDKLKEKERKTGLECMVYQMQCLNQCTLCA